MAVDPHKWLYAPLEAGCALVRDPSALRNAFSYHPAYYNFEGEGLNYYDIGPQNSRGFRALKVWLALQQAGAAGYREMIQDDITLARYLYDLALDHPELEALTHHLSITTLRYVPQELRAEQGSRRDGRVSERIEPAPAGSDREKRRGIHLECGDRRQVRAAILHREFPDFDWRH